MAKRHGNVLSDSVLHAWSESGSRDMYVQELHSTLTVLRQIPLLHGSNGR